MANQVYHGLLEITTALKDFTVDVDAAGPTAVALDVGLYYIAGYTGETQLCEHVQAKIRAIGTTCDTSTVVYSFTTGLVTITFSGTVPGTDYVLTWTDAGLGTLLGYSGTITTTVSTAEVATNEARYTWCPDVDAADRPVALSQWWEPQSKTVARRARDGTVYTGQGPTVYGASIAYSMLARSRVLIPEGGVSINIEFEQFYLDVLAAGRKFRVYPDDTATTITDYVTAVLASSDDSIPSFRQIARPYEPPSHTHWDVSMTMWKDV